MKKLAIGLLLSVVSVSAFANTDHITSIDSRAIQAYMDSFGVTHDEAAKRLAIMDQSGEILDKLIQQFGEDSIAGIFFDNGKDFKIIIRTTGRGNRHLAVTEFVQENLKDLQIEVIPNSPRNFRSIQNIIENQSARLARQLPGFQSLSYSPENDSLILDVVLPDGITKSEFIKRYKLDKISGMDVVINEMAAPLSLSMLVGGGQIISNADLNLTSRCTSGWPARNSHNEYGFLTAFHCVPNINQVINYTDKKGSFYNLVASDVTRNSHDLIFLKNTSGAKIIEPQFYKDNTDTLYYVTKPYTRNGLTIGGTQLCHFGNVTEFSCGIVTHIEAQMMNEKNSQQQGKGCNTDHPTCGPMVVISGRSLKCASGDSGGPVWFGNSRPIGIASACNLADIRAGKPAIMFFSPVDYAHEVGATVLSVSWSQ